jgi:hypothetical protein
MIEIANNASADHLNLGFFNAVSLHAPGALFEGTGRPMRHIKLFPGSPIPEAQIIAWFAEVVMQVKSDHYPESQIDPSFHRFG